MKNREIKFRVWDEVNNKFIEDGEDFSIRDLGGGFGYQIIYLQYTGLKDKNGKEIYEGDILRVSQVDKVEDIELEETKSVGMVKYLEEAACFTLGHPKNPYFRLDMYLLDERIPRGDGNYNHSYSIAPWRLEIIGNIFENPELLENGT